MFLVRPGVIKQHKTQKNSFNFHKRILVLKIVWKSQVCAEILHTACSCNHCYQSSWEVHPSPQAELFGGWGFGGWDSGVSIYTTLSSRSKSSNREGESICYPQPSTSQIIPPMPESSRSTRPIQVITKYISKVMLSLALLSKNIPTSYYWS